KLPGTFVYINRDPTVHIVPIDQFVDIKVPAGTVHIRVTSNQPGCIDREDDVVVTPGAHKRILRNANCPGV
ncbi:MAG: hypothetical protein ACREL5_07705, partial [Gemmatimonadales bacterium]